MNRATLLHVSIMSWPGRVARWCRSNPIPAVASAAGVALVALSFGVDGNWSALSLEVGSGLGLVVVVYELEKLMATRLEERQDAKLDAMEQRLESRITANEAGSRVVAAARRQRTDVADAFIDDPTPERLALLADEAERVAVPRATQVAVADDWLLNVNSSRNPYGPGEAPRAIVQIKVIKQSQNRQSTPVDWNEEQSYDDMLAKLRLVWAQFDSDWPGDDQFSDIDFARLVASGYSDAIDKRLAGRSSS